jgi:hypothetical protein
LIRNDNAGCAEAAAAGRRGELHSRDQLSGTCICVYTWRHVYPYKLYTLLFTLIRCGMLSIIKVLSKDIEGKIYNKYCRYMEFTCIYIGHSLSSKKR